MSNGQLIYLMVAIAVILILAYVTAIFLRKRNVSRLTALEERKEELYNLPVNDEVEAVKNMHLIGQSQVTFREWNQKWVDLSLNSFADIENHLFEAESYNNSFRFFKAAHKIDQIESQISLIEEDIAAIRNALSELEKQESKNSGRVLHALDLFETLQHTVAEDSEKYGKALPEIEKQLENIQSEFSQFVTLNSSGDPVEAAAILDDTENHILALTHIVDRIPALVETLTKELPDQLADLEEGYRKLLDAKYHFIETDIESRFQLLHESLKNNQENIRQLELDNAEYENNRIQEEINALYDIFTHEIEAQKVVENLLSTLPTYLNHLKENNQVLGFVSIENILYFFAHGTSVGLSVFRSIFVFSVHLLSSLICTLVWWKSLGEKFGSIRYFLWFVLGILGATLVHTLYNYSISNGNNILFFPYAAAAYGLFVYLIKK